MHLGVVIGADLAPGHLRAVRLPRLSLKGLSQEAAVLLLKSSGQPGGIHPSPAIPRCSQPCSLPQCLRRLFGTWLGWDGPCTVPLAAVLQLYPQRAALSSQELSREGLEYAEL